MQSYQRLLPLPLLVVLALPAAAQLAPGWTFDGEFQIGYRAVDVDGREEKFREDFGLEQGPRLFNLDFELTPPEQMRGLFDRIEVDLSNLGGDPYETIRVSVEKYARFSLTYDHRKSSYFYEDIILPPELSDPALADVGDLHHFDLDRVRDQARLKLWLTKKAHLHFSFDRFTRKGSSTTTLDIERDEFELEQPIDESLNELSLAFEYSWERASLSVEERVRDFESAAEAYLPGYSPGEDPEDDTVLLAYRLAQPYDLNGLAHTVRFATTPVDRLTLRFSGVLENAELDFEAEESLLGTAWTGDPLEYEAQGDGRVDSDRLLLDLDLSWRMTDRWSLVAGVRHRDLDQKGELIFDGVPTNTAWQIETTGYELGLEVAAGRGWKVSGGVRAESREVLEGEMEKETTDHTGYFLGISWRPQRHLSVDLELEDSSFDDPYTLSSPSDRQIYRLAVRYGKQRGWQARLSTRAVSIVNEASGWEADSTSWSGELGYRSPLMSAYLGYTGFSIDRSIDQTVLTLPVEGGVELFYPIAYEGDSALVYGRLLWAVWGTVRIGAEARLYDNTGSFPVQRQDLYGFTEIGFGQGYLTRFGYRAIDHDEGRADWDDYSAGIAEISIGRRW